MKLEFSAISAFVIILKSQNYAQTIIMCGKFFHLLVREGGGGGGQVCCAQK